MTAPRQDPTSRPHRTRAERLAKLAATRLYVCTDARTDRDDLPEFLDAAYSGGAGIVQLRDKGLEAAAELERLRTLAGIAERHDALFAVNDRADIALLSGADVLHVGQGDLATPDARALVGQSVLIGRSTHSHEQVLAANDDPGLDYFCVGPVWETPTKLGRPGVGLELVRFAAEAARKPWFAIGGVAAGERLHAVRKAGAERIVVVRAVTEATDPAAAARALAA
ncbi:thiamine phosphate synthase [Gulosibacter faecalis]|jgi:thiamine-phosphate pyrophosphorylase|uniref:Thiamine-phosphate synthase n=1 Tax=Gulosibacter faecalis TaxID=272240 RepID=A0ABW5V0Y2_9MICO|nr:thiamine phosphate synthase [Gulosibacter faecalis]